MIKNKSVKNKGIFVYTHNSHSFPTIFYSYNIINFELDTYHCVLFYSVYYLLRLQQVRKNFEFDHFIILPYISLLEEWGKLVTFSMYCLSDNLLSSSTSTVGIFKFFTISDNTALMQNAYNIILYFIRECFPGVIHVKLALFEFYAFKFLVYFTSCVKYYFVLYLQLLYCQVLRNVFQRFHVKQ